VSHWLLVPDCHWPYANKRAFDLMLSTGPYDGVVVVGDFVDFAKISKHDRSPRRLASLDEELEAGKAALACIRAAVRRATKKNCILHEGNHEARMEAHIAKHAPEFQKIVGTASQHLDPKGGWTHVRYGELHRIGKLYTTHDQGPAGPGCAAKTLGIVGRNVAFGHSHRLEVCYQGAVDGSRRVGVSCGTLADLDSVAFDYAKPTQRAAWQLGFATAHIERDLVFVQAHPIVNYTCSVNGKLYR